jgi:hypothetical protein
MRGAYMMIQEEVEEFEETWKKQGRYVRILHWPGLVLADINSTFSAAELERIAEFLRKCEDERI